MPNSPTHCPLCAAAVSLKTLEKCDGVCRRCAKQPIALRSQWVFFGMLALLAPIVAYFTDQELAEMERSGGEIRILVLLAFCYRLGGRIGVAMSFAAVGLLFATLAYRSFRESLAIRDQLEELKRRPIRREG